MFGKLEGRITVPTGGWDISADEGGGAETATIPAGEYYLSSVGDGGSNDLLAELKSQLDASALTGVFTCSVAAGEGGTGKVTIASTVSFTATWDDTDLRDCLGFTANLTPTATSHTSAGSARSLWLPDGPGRALNGSSSAGRMVAHLLIQESAGGHLNGLMGPRKRVNAIDWQGISRDRMWEANESVANQSLEKFVQDVIFGEASWSTTPLGPLRWHPDADTDGSYFTYRGGFTAIELEQLESQWVEQWSWRFPRLVEVPA